MRLLALDYGTKNIGLALTDTSLDVVFPFGVVQTSEWKKILDIVKSERIEKIIIGLPLGLGGEETVNTHRVREFANLLQNEISLPFEFVDERFSSHEADNMGGESSRDEKSAMIVLETYLQKSFRN